MEFDIQKIIALTATATRAAMIGRPFAYGLAVAGEHGVREVLRNLVAELEVTTILAGYERIAEVGREALAVSPSSASG